MSRDPAKAGAKGAVLDINELEEGVVRRTLEIGPEVLGLEDQYFEFPAPFKAELEIGRSIETYLVKGTIDCPVRGECCRCLETATQVVRAPVHFLFQRKEASEEELAALEEEDLQILDPGAREIDLTECLREAAILELPMRLYCRDECKGLCGQCGQNLNSGTCTCEAEQSDPRWAALGDLKLR